MAVLTTLILAISFEPLKVRLTNFAKRFDEDPEATAGGLPIPDDAWIDTVAARVIERLETGRVKLPQPERDESRSSAATAPAPNP